MKAISHFVTAAPEAKRFAVKRLDEIAWGLVLVLTGGLWLLPVNSVPPGTWLFGSGLILISLNAIRHYAHMGINLFTLLLGVLALGGGFAQMRGVELPLFALMVVLVGASIIIRAVLQRNDG